MRTRTVSPKIFTKTLLRGRIKQFNALQQGTVSWSRGKHFNKGRAYIITGWGNTWAGLTCKEACELVSSMTMLTKTGQMNINKAEMRILALEANKEELEREVASLRAQIEQNTSFVIGRGREKQPAEEGVQQELPEYDTLLEETDTLKRRIIALQKDLDEILEIEEIASKELNDVKREAADTRRMLNRKAASLQEALATIDGLLVEEHNNKLSIKGLELHLTETKENLADCNKDREQLRKEVSDLKAIADSVKKARAVADAVIGKCDPENDMTKSELFFSLANDEKTMYDWIKYINANGLVMRRHESLFNAFCDQLKTYKKLPPVDVTLALTLLSENYFGVVVF